MSTSTKSPDFLNLPGKQSFPFEYGKVLLFDELKLRAYKQQIELYQSKDYVAKNPNTAAFQALEASEKKIQTSIEAENKRDAFYTQESIHRYFGLKGQLKYYGFGGWLISLFLSDKIQKQN